MNTECECVLDFIIFVDNFDEWSEGVCGTATRPDDSHVGGEAVVIHAHYEYGGVWGVGCYNNTFGASV